MHKQKSEVELGQVNNDGSGGARTSGAGGDCGGSGNDNKYTEEMRTCVQARSSHIASSTYQLNGISPSPSISIAIASG